MKVEIFKKSRKMPLLKAAATHPNIQNFGLYWLGENYAVHSYLKSDDGESMAPVVWGNPFAKNVDEFTTYAEGFFTFINSLVSELKAA